MALFRHIASRQTGSLDLSHLVVRHSTFDGKWGLARSAAALADTGYGLHLLLTPFAPSAWIRKRSRWKPPLYDYLSLIAPILTAQAAHHYRDDSAALAISSPGVSLP